LGHRVVGNSGTIEIQAILPVNGRNSLERRGGKNEGERRETKKLKYC